MIDEIDKMVGMMESGETLVQAVEIMYPKNFDKENGLELLLLFIKGLKHNNFFEYAKFINGIKVGKRAN